jgi:hypothetical protein
MEDTRTDLKIDNGIATWEINATGAISGTFIGIFRFKCFLSPLQQIAAGREERELIGASAALAPEHEKFLAFALSQLKYRIISAPPFWNTGGNINGDIPDEEIISLILSAAIDAEALYKQQIKERKEAAIKRARTAAEHVVKVELEAREEEEELQKS